MYIHSESCSKEGYRNCFILVDVGFGSTKGNQMGVLKLRVALRRVGYIQGLCTFFAIKVKYKFIKIIE